MRRLTALGLSGMLVLVASGLTLVEGQEPGGPGPGNPGDLVCEGEMFDASVSIFYRSNPKPFIPRRVYASASLRYRCHAGNMYDCFYNCKLEIWNVDDQNEYEDKTWTFDLDCDDESGIWHHNTDEISGDAGDMIKARLSVAPFPGEAQTKETTKTLPFLPEEED